MTSAGVPGWHGALRPVRAHPGWIQNSVLSPRLVPANPGVKPTIVLVHGAFADNSSWGAVVPQLQGLGYTVDVPPNPLRGVSYDSAYLSDFLSTISGPVVLVGHSYGGFIITNVGASDPEVKALVYVDSYLPAAGETLNYLNSVVKGTCITPKMLNAVPYPGSTSGNEDLYVKPSAFPGCFVNGVPHAQAAVLAPSNSRWQNSRRPRS